MPFSAGDLCCPSDACVLLEVGAGSAVSWDLIPHVTQVGVTQQANTPKLVTSSTGGQEQSICGTVSTNGTLTLACHDGTSPDVLCINQVYRIRWSVYCSNIWDGSAAVVSPTGIYFDARIRITTVPLISNISQASAVEFAYQWELIEWMHFPDCQSSVE